MVIEKVKKRKLNLPPFHQSKQISGKGNENLT
jgi:hypothetical protein